MYSSDSSNPVKRQHGLPNGELHSKNNHLEAEKNLFFCNFKTRQSKY